MGKFIKYGSFKSFIKSVNEGFNDEMDYDEDEENLGYDPAVVTAKINAAIIWINIKKPEYAELLSEVDIYGSDKIDPKTMCTDGKRIIFHPEFVMQQSAEAIRFVLAHELLHCIGDHMTRRENRNPTIWNYACDYAINPILDGEEGFAWPKNEDDSRMGLLDPQYSGMRAEDIYDAIKDKPLPKTKNDPGHVVDEGTPLPKPSPGLEVQVSDDDEEYDDEEYDDDYDEYDDEYGDDGDGEEGEDGEDDEDGDGSGSGEGEDEEGEDEDNDEENGEGGESGEEGEDEDDEEWQEEVYQAKAGDLIKSKDGRYGKITSVNSDGTYDIQEMTEEEIKKAVDGGDADVNEF